MPHYFGESIREQYSDIETNFCLRLDVIERRRNYKTEFRGISNVLTLLFILDFKKGGDTNRLYFLLCMLGDYSEIYGPIYMILLVLETGFLISSYFLNLKIIYLNSGKLRNKSRSLNSTHFTLTECNNLAHVNPYRETGAVAMSLRYLRLEALSGTAILVDRRVACYQARGLFVLSHDTIKKTIITFYHDRKLIL